MTEYIAYQCKTCKKHFILYTKEVEHSEEESKFLTCPYYGKHKDITVVNRYANIKEIMESARVYKRIGGRMVQIK